jgi:transcriptional antiterminator NusG
MDKQWYVVSAYSGCEENVARALRERIDQSTSMEHFGKVVVPTEMVVEMRAGKRNVSKRKVFPGYVMVEMHCTDETWHLVRFTPQVTGFIGGETSERPVPLNDKEAQEILRRMDAGVDESQPRSVLNAGEKVRIIDGPFSDFSATVEEVNYEKGRLKVAVSILGRSTSLELELMQVEKI